MSRYLVCLALYLYDACFQIFFVRNTCGLFEKPELVPVGIVELLGPFDRTHHRDLRSRLDGGMRREHRVGRI